MTAQFDRRLLRDMASSQMAYDTLVAGALVALGHTELAEKFKQAIDSEAGIAANIEYRLSVFHKSLGVTGDEENLFHRWTLEAEEPEAITSARRTLEEATNIAGALRGEANGIIDANSFESEAPAW